MEKKKNNPRNYSSEINLDIWKHIEKHKIRIYL